MRGGWASLLAKISASKCFLSFAEQNLGFFFKFSLSFGLSSSFCNINFACLGYIFMLVLMTHGVSEHIQHTMRQVAATHCTGRSLLEYRSGNWLQQHVRATCYSDKLLHNNNNNFIYIALIS